MNNQENTQEKCPCNSDQWYLECCGQFIIGDKLPESPEELMRSRYTAFTQSNIQYIKNTMASAALIDFDQQGAEKWAESVNLYKLIVASTDDRHVEFAAYYEQDGKNHVMHELSLFDKIDGKWFYVFGEHKKTGRNEQCFCGSGQKFKRCCATLI